MKRECITVIDYYDNTKTYDVFFRRNGKGTNPQGKLCFYYAQNTPIAIGTIFVLKGLPYLVISQDGIESDIYFTSMAVKCDTTFSVWSNTDSKYVNVPCAVISDKYTLTHNSTISMVSGSVTVYTGLNDYAQDMSINSAYYNFGGYYKVGNVFYNNGLAYVYMTREAMPTQDTYLLAYNGVTSIDMSDTTTYQLSYTATKNGITVDNPTLTYVSNNESVATVSDSGLLTILVAGNVKITATWTDGNNTTCSTSITIANGDTPEPSTGGTSLISGNSSLRNGFSRTYTAYFYDNNGNEVTGITAIWSITDCTFESSLTLTETDTTIKIEVDDDNLIGETFTLKLAETSGDYTPSSIEISIIESF